MPQNTGEEVAGGLAGKLIGKVKQAAGDLVDNDELKREGTLQEAQGDAEVEAREREAQARAASEKADLEGEQLDNEAERARLRIEVEEASRRAEADAERQEAGKAETTADIIEQKGD